MRKLGKVQARQFSQPKLWLTVINWINQQKLGISTNPYSKYGKTKLAEPTETQNIVKTWGIYISLNVRRWEFNCEILYFIFRQTVGMGPSVCHDKIQGCFLAPPGHQWSPYLRSHILYNNAAGYDHLYEPPIYMCVCVLAGMHIQPDRFMARQFVSETKTLDFMTLCPLYIYITSSSRPPRFPWWIQHDFSTSWRPTSIGTSHAATKQRALETWDHWFRLVSLNLTIIALGKL
jgi:hypothetical protein